MVLRGHAIECRINAEDFRHGFRPCPGRTGFSICPEAPACGWDTPASITAMRSVPSMTPLVASFIVHAPTRLEAIRRMRRALAELVIEGNIPPPPTLPTCCSTTPILSGASTTRDFWRTHGRDPLVGLQWRASN